MTESVRRYSLSGVIVENSEVAAVIMLRSVPSIYISLVSVCVAERNRRHKV